MKPRDRDAAPTRERLLATAAELFAERGFHATRARDIAARARVNLAAAHYHFGSKRDLYLEVLRRQFADIRATMARRGVAPDAAELARLARPQVAGLLRARIRTMSEIIIGPPLSLHGALMQREMCDPSEALPMIIEEFIRPLLEDTQRIVARLVPDLDANALRRCVFSIVGQLVFYHFAMPAALRIMGLERYPAGFGTALAGHVADFSLGGLREVSRAAPSHPSGHPRRSPRGAVNEARHA